MDQLKMELDHFHKFLVGSNLGSENTIVTLELMSGLELGEGGTWPAVKPDCHATT